MGSDSAACVSSASTEFIPMKGIGASSLQQICAHLSCKLVEALPQLRESKLHELLLWKCPLQQQSGVGALR